MQTAAQAATLALSNRSSAPLPKTSTAERHRLAQSTLNELWNRMAAMYGHTWLSQYGANPEGLGGDTWAAALAGITAMQIADGMRACVAAGAEWPPSAPRFRAMCLSIPDICTVRRELHARDSTCSRFTAFVWQHLDAYRWRMATADQADRLLREAYDVAHDHVMRGGALPEPPVAELEHVPEQRRPASEHVVRDAFAKVAAALADEE